MVAEISAAAWAYANSDKLETLVKDSVQTTVKKEYSVIPSRTETFDSIQSGVSWLISFIMLSTVIQLIFSI